MGLHMAVPQQRGYIHLKLQSPTSAAWGVYAEVLMLK